jgi:DNA-binding IclR family transcriptional regulator
MCNAVAISATYSTTAAGGNVSQSVKRAAGILESIAAQPKTVAQLAEEFGLHRTTMFRELQTLEEVGYVRRRVDGRYGLSLHLVALAQTALEEVDLRQAAFAQVRRLHKTVGDTIHVAALVDDQIVYVDKAEDSSGVRMYSRIGSAVRPQCSALGKAILAGLSVPARDAVLAGTQWKKYTDTTITSRAAFDAELAVVARQGWAADDGEFEDFINCVAVPIRTSAGTIGALSLTALRQVHNLEQVKTHLPLMQAAAERIARELG